MDRHRLAKVGDALSIGFNVDRVLGVVMLEGDWSQPAQAEVLNSFANLLEGKGSGAWDSDRGSTLLGYPQFLKAAEQAGVHDMSSARRLAERIAAVLRAMGRGERPDESDLGLVRDVFAELARTTLDQADRLLRGPRQALHTY